MSNTQMTAAVNRTPEVAPGDMSLEVVVVPVSDVDRAKSFYATTLGFTLHADVMGDDGFRVVQVTPPGSRCSIIFGAHVTADLIGRGVDVSEVFHDIGGVFHHAGTDGRVAGPDPGRSSYGSFASFSDPDGNGWVLQEITSRFEGR